MPETESCPYIDDADIDHRYIAGTLPDAEAEEFERHYFGCDLCWARVQRGAEIGSAFEQPLAAKGVRTIGSAPQRGAFIKWATPLAAAAVVAIAIGLWRDRPARVPVDVTASSSSANAMRGRSASLMVSSHATKDVLMASWSKPPQAISYLVRLLGADGALLFQRETTDTSIVLPADSARAAVPSGSGYWQIQAFDELRKTVATSPLTPVSAAKDSS